LIPERWRAFLLLNPMAPTVQGFRWALLGDVAPPNLQALAAAIALAMACLTVGLVLFQRTERTIADSI
jgi:lipopolysaccharide transport system permease protein